MKIDSLGTEAARLDMCYLHTWTSYVIVSSLEVSTRGSLLFLDMDIDCQWLVYRTPGSLECLLHVIMKEEGNSGMTNLVTVGI